MPAPKPAKQQRRNRAFEETHNQLIEAAVRLIAGKGVESLSIAALAREVGINRTTVYYHFDSRETLIREVKAWSSNQLGEAFSQDRPLQARIEHIYRFVLGNPELLKMWIDDYLAVGDIRTLYRNWDDLVAGTAARFAASEATAGIDAEVYCVNLLTSAFIGPLVFKNSVHPEADIDEVVERFKAESLRTLHALALVEPD
ncbi:TetR/AcrR family transcriptional regulator [Mangrovimicrobium sediminis]|uniref:TetR/AcrR family transcriptional regulator n=1 Tax=Mangrovimicrobium sediminis TaxID=2562682 RepID=A0A4Z0M543_9GAMM|nr:TetR/AcrR family transcriptional regulator [Haliea sp. SAOS-164]TGD74772.1 TetR/AcrR family transcriptional regulator [Haliea sp. SAOS-164]